MVLEYLPGGTLEDLLRQKGRLPDADVHRIAAEIAAGLAHAHAHGLVHRDLKPSNVLFDDEGRAKIADFGIASMATGGATLTEAGTVLGTAAYISPEQASGLPATSASDVYSFGVILYRMLAGALPFESTHPLALVMQHRDAIPLHISSLRTDATTIAPPPPPPAMPIVAPPPPATTVDTTPATTQTSPATTDTASTGSTTTGP